MPDRKYQAAAAALFECMAAQTAPGVAGMSMWVMSSRPARRQASITSIGRIVPSGTTSTTGPLLKPAAPSHTPASAHQPTAARSGRSNARQQA